MPATGLKRLKNKRKLSFCPLWQWLQYRGAAKWPDQLNSGRATLPRFPVWRVTHRELSTQPRRRLMMDYLAQAFKSLASDLNDAESRLRGND